MRSAGASEFFLVPSTSDVIGRKQYKFKTGPRGIPRKQKEMKCAPVTHRKIFKKVWLVFILPAGHTIQNVWKSSLLNVTGHEKADTSLDLSGKFQLKICHQCFVSEEHTGNIIALRCLWINMKNAYLLKRL